MARGATAEKRPASGKLSAGVQDAVTILIFLALTAIVAWNRFVFDSWLSRFDVYTQFLPWYHYLGERTRELDVPGWNPHLLSGTPFAGHPMSGWMYLPAMVAFSLFPVLAGFKVMVASHLVIGGLSSYAFVRVLGMGPLAALVVAVAFAFGPFLEWNTYTSLQFAQFAAWLPVALLGIELALCASGWRRRLVPWSLAGVAVSQMFAGWVGEGWLYAVLLPGAYIGYRALLAPPRRCLHLNARLALCATSGAAVFGSGVALGAAGILPRLSTNAQTNLAGGSYASLGGGGTLNAPWELDYLFTQIMGMGTGYHHRAAGFGGAVVVLMLLSLILARTRFAVPFFAGLTIVSLVLTLDTTPIHHFFYLIPRYQELHEHDPWRVVSLASIGPAVLCGAAVEMLGRMRGQYTVLPVVVALSLSLMAVAAAPGELRSVAGWAPIIAAAIVMEIVVFVIASPPDSELRRALRWFPRATAALVVAVVFLQPTGLELTGSWLGWPEDQRWERRWNPDPQTEQARATEVMDADPGGAGGYLQAQLADSGPFRYLGYGGVGHPEGGWNARSYMDRRFDPHAQAILVNGRPVFLDLYEIQGYDPIQLARYVDFIMAINGKGQDYHTAFVSDEGVGSSLLDLLDVRYILVDASLPLDRADVVTLTSGHQEVFRTDRVVVYESQDALPHAWIVHEVSEIEQGEALPLLISGEVDPYRTALVEGEVPEMEPAEGEEPDRAVVTEYDADAIEIKTYAGSPGFLVVSEVYAEGWKAYVNGEPVDILPTHHALRGVPIPAGDATVEMRYEPLALRIGIPVSAGAALVILGIASYAGLRNFGAFRVASSRRE